MPEPNDLQPSQAMIGNWSLHRYLQLLRWPTVTAAILVLGLTVLRIPSTGVLGVTLLDLLVAGWLVYRQHGRRTEALTAGAIVGLALGAATSIASFILKPGALSAINVIGQTIMTAAVGSLLAAGALIAIETFTHT